jgi:hypothetical protein
MITTELVSNAVDQGHFTQHCAHSQDGQLDFTRPAAAVYPHLARLNDIQLPGMIVLMEEVRPFIVYFGERLS